MLRLPTNPLWEYAADLDQDGTPALSSIPGREENRVYQCKLRIAADKVKTIEREVSEGTNHFRNNLQKAHKLNVSAVADKAQERHTAEAVRVAEMQTWST